MSESLKITTQNKFELQQELLPQFEALISRETSRVAALGNICAVIKEYLNIFWVGFYFVEHGELRLGPFQGSIACSPLHYGRGVCGTAWKDNKTIFVPDVEQFPGHIACSSSSRSEIVTPIRNKNGEVIAVLDIDSDKIDDFSQADVIFYEKLSDLVSKYCF